MKSFLLFLLSIVFYFSATAQYVYLDTTGTVSFFSETVVEDIDATSNQAVDAMNIKTKAVFFKVRMSTLKFKKALMQEHFNENYMESDKYPFAIFQGNIDQDIDLTKDGTYQVTVTGTLTIHGVAQNRTIPGTVVVSGKSIDVTSSFDVKVADHQIRIPTIVTEHIAESVKVKVHSVLTPAQR
ncbi:MAG TPA: YceI family protein [Chitinophagales bacterium]|nr:YceI family protein [Chitinophagales bacterium]